MKGTWKNNLSGWNLKDSKRKKQTRKHFFRDNGKYYSKHDEDCKSCRIEGAVEVTSEKEYKYGKTINIYKIKISKYSDSLGEKFSYRYGYLKEISKFQKEWYDAFTGNKIYTFGVWDITIEYIAWTKYEHFEEPVIVKKPNYCFLRWNTTESLFVHDKPYYHWERYNGFKDYPRKWAQKEVNRSNRAKLRNYIKKGDWNKIPKEHPCTKSIDWMIS